MGKAVQHMGTAAQSLYSLPVVFLVQKESGFLAIFHIHAIPDTVLLNLHLGIKSLTHKPFI